MSNPFEQIDNTVIAPSIRTIAVLCAVVLFVSAIAAWEDVFEFLRLVEGLV